MYCFSGEQPLKRIIASSTEFFVSEDYIMTKTFYIAYLKLDEFYVACHVLAVLLVQKFCCH